MVAFQITLWHPRQGRLRRRQEELQDTTLVSLRFKRAFFIASYLADFLWPCWTWALYQQHPPYPTRLPTDTLVKREADFCGYGTQRHRPPVSDEWEAERELPLEATGACLLFDQTTSLMDSQGNYPMTEDLRHTWEQLLLAMVTGEVPQAANSTTCPHITDVLLLNPFQIGDDLARLLTPHFAFAFNCTGRGKGDWQEDYANLLKAYCPSQDLGFFSSNGKQEGDERAFQTFLRQDPMLGSWGFPKDGSTDYSTCYFAWRLIQIVGLPGTRPRADSKPGVLLFVKTPN